MVDDIVYLSKLTSGSMQVNMEKINLKCFLEQVLFEWKVDNLDFENSDKLIVRYKFVEFSLTGNLEAKTKDFVIKVN